MDITVRLATHQDLDALLFLEESCFAEPWSRKNLEAELKGNQFSRLFVVPHPSGTGSQPPLIAYLCCWIVFEELRFLNLAVWKDFRRQGIARTLISHTIFEGIKAGCRRGLLEVRSSNYMAQQLYARCNFQAYATRKSYYTNPVEDAILMVLDPLDGFLSEGISQASHNT